MARPKFEPTAEQKLDVEAMLAAGMRQREVARAVGITEKTLRLHFANELRHGAARARAAVLGQLYRAALAGDLTAARFLCRQFSAAKKSSPKKAEPGPDPDSIWGQMIANAPRLEDLPTGPFKS